MQTEFPIIYFREDEEAFYNYVPDPEAPGGRKEIIIYKKDIRKPDKFVEFEGTGYTEEEFLDMRFYPTEQE